ncbi:hypothetical protein CRENBAI_022324 [Crenichthys baileyi]|uniref:Uncharacterized protein n=1 Tax=Crenichthys baileyi TaxID=28760 RepID=A0AAV9RWI2_9TELE
MGFLGVSKIEPTRGRAQGFEDELPQSLVPSPEEFVEDLSPLPVSVPEGCEDALPPPAVSRRLRRRSPRPRRRSQRSLHHSPGFQRSPHCASELHRGFSWSGRWSSDHRLLPIACAYVTGLLIACPYVAGLLIACPYVAGLLIACAYLAGLLIACPYVAGLLIAYAYVAGLLIACPYVAGLLITVSARDGLRAGLWAGRLNSGSPGDGLWAA